MLKALTGLRPSSEDLTVSLENGNSSLQVIENLLRIFLDKESEFVSFEQGLAWRAVTRIVWRGPGAKRLEE